jgi:mRNA-degrading endonuclease RelE of RelBE toxin-antitoxin system
VKAYTVLWRQTATDQLAEIWLEASDRAHVTQVVEAIDTLLATDPLGDLTRELAEGLRTTTVLPLRVIYEVHDVDRIVDVATVRRVD